MFTPNQVVLLRRPGGYDLFGKPKLGRPVSVPACVVKLESINTKTTVRADSSATRGAAREILAEARFLLDPASQPTADCTLEFRGKSYKIASIHERFDVFGRLDHVEVGAEAWRE